MFEFFKLVNTILSKRASHIKIKRTMVYKNKSPFLDETSGLAIAKMLDKEAQSTMMLKLRFY